MADDRKRQHAWRTGASASSGPIATGAKKPGGAKRFIVIALILAVIGAVAGLTYFLWPPPKALFAGVALTQYDKRAYAPNSWAQHDSDGLRDRFEADSGAAFQAQEKQGLLDLLSQVANSTNSGKDRNRPVVVFINALATVRDGKVYVLPGRADPDNRSTWLPFEEVLAGMRKCAGSRLLILDLSHPMADPHAGLLLDHVAEALHAELTAAVAGDKLPFFVLTSCSPGEVSHVSPELQRSVFGFFVDRALRGNGDGWKGPKDKEGRVSAQELAEYVGVQVSTWAKQQGLTSQMPSLYGKVDDFIIISPRQDFEKIAMPESTFAYPDWLVAGWQERQNWKAANAFRLLPRGYRELETMLMISEARWLSGLPEEPIKAELKGRIDDLNRQRQELTPPKVPPHSIAQAKRLGIKDEQRVGNELRALLGNLQRSKVLLKPDELAPVKEMFKEKPPMMDKPPEELPYEALAYHVLAAVRRLDDPTIEQVKNFDAVLQAVPLAARFAEAATLHFLADLDPAVQGKWNTTELAGTRRLVLDVSAMAEEAAAIDPRCVPWVKSELVAADAKHRDGLTLLASGGVEERIVGRNKLKEALEVYDQMSKRAKLLEQAYLRLEEARVLLPALVYPFSRRGSDANDVRLWSALVAAIDTLQRSLAKQAVENEGQLKAIDSTSADLQSHMGQINDLFGPGEVAKQLGRIKEGKGLAAHELRRLLESPLWLPNHRLELHKAAFEQGQSALQAGIDQSNGLAPGAVAPTAVRKPLEVPAWRAKLALDLLRLDGVTEMKPLNDLFQEAERENKPAKWERLGDAIRKAWAVTLPEKYRTLPDSAREQPGTIVHPIELSSLPESPGKPPHEPTPALRKGQTREWLQWLISERYRAAAKTLRTAAQRPDMEGLAVSYDEIARQLQNHVP